MISSLPTIANAVESIKLGELTPLDLVEFCLHQIDRHEAAVQAWVSVDADGARREAERLGKLAREGQMIGPLHGIPIGIKDIIDVQGWPTKAGSPLRGEHVAGNDAVLVTRLREAGAILLGKTVTTEFACFDPAATRNPWNLAHTPGGSSSGSAAAVALGMCHAAIGTQTGGSIIRPASYCGVAGLKPTFGHVSLAGVVPVSARLDHAGPLAQSVSDLVSVLLAIVEPAGLEQLAAEPLRSGSIPDWNPAAVRADPESVRGYLFDKLGSERRSAKLHLVEEYFMPHATDAVQATTRAALARVQDAWSAERTLELPASFGQVRDHHLRIMAVDAARCHRLDYQAHPQQYGPCISELIEQGLAERAVDYAAAVEHQAQFKQDLAAMFEDGSIAVMPATTSTAPTLETTGDPALNAPWSYAGVPAATIACGLDADGMPCGLQLVGPANGELRLLKAAVWCEEKLAFAAQPALLRD